MSEDDKSRDSLAEAKATENESNVELLAVFGVNTTNKDDNA